MILDAASIKWLHVESTTKCNAWCPGCGRNKGGYELADGLELADLTTDALEQACLQLPNLEVIQFCPTYGDPLAADNIMEQVRVAKKYSKKIQLHTNGSLRNTEWWANLAAELSDVEHDVWFTLDGLEGVHEVYRQGTFFNKIIDNARAFINAGGYATWQFIPWAHNEHQITDCIKLSQQIGFKKFKLINRVRPVPIARHYKTGDSYELKPWSRNEITNPLTFVRNRVELQNCMHLSIPSIYLNYNGKLSRCCRYNLKETFDLVGNIDDQSDKILNDASEFCVYNCGS